MSCTENVCGTGGWTGPKPGDPDNNIFITANTVYGGINVAWSYPATNGHAVAYFKLFRGLNADLENAIELPVVTGTIYYDKINPQADTQYYYWVQMVSSNGTVNDPIGPASATARPLGQQTLETLTGLIDAGVLATELKQEIEKITLNRDELLAEIAARIAGNAELSAALALVQAGVEESIGLIHEESLTRQNGQDALASQLLTIAAVNQSNAAAILTEKTARVTADSALAQTIDQVYAATKAAAAAVVTETTARTEADNALASQITTVQSTLNGNIASVQQSMETEIAVVDGIVQQIAAQYMAKVSVNGLIGGFGLYNNGQIVEAGFDVDRFWIGRTNANKVKPFIIDDDVVYINKARIRDADIDTLKIAGNAVTQPVFAKQTGSQSILTWTGTSWASGGEQPLDSELDFYDILYLGVNFGSTPGLNAKAMVGFTMNHGTGGGGGWMIRWRIVRHTDNVIIARGDMGNANNVYGGPTVTAMGFDENAGNGIKYYKLQVANYGDITTARSVSGATLFALGAKR